MENPGTEETNTGKYFLFSFRICVTKSAVSGSVIFIFSKTLCGRSQERIESNTSNKWDFPFPYGPIKTVACSFASPVTAFKYLRNINMDDRVGI